MKKLNYWSRKIHIHLGLFFLFFIWLFSLSGLLLNHSHKWKFAGFWEERKEKTLISAVIINSNADSSEILQGIMQQLLISGEVSRVNMNHDSIDFRVSIPGIERDLHVNLKNGICVLKELRFNGWGKMRILHTFNGINKNNFDLKPNWIVTRIWQFTKDMVAVGLILLCISSWIIWYRLRRKYRWGLIFLLSGMGLTIYYVILLRLI